MMRGAGEGERWERGFYGIPSPSESLYTDPPLNSSWIISLKWKLGQSILFPVSIHYFRKVKEIIANRIERPRNKRSGYNSLYPTAVSIGHHGEQWGRRWWGANLLTRLREPVMGCKWSNDTSNGLQFVTPSTLTKCEYAEKTALGSRLPRINVNLSFQCQRKPRLRRNFLTASLKTAIRKYAYFLFTMNGYRDTSAEKFTGKVGLHSDGSPRW